MEGTGIFGSLDCLTLVVINPATKALEIPREAVLAVTHLSLL